MNDLAALIAQVRAGDPAAYEPIVRQFQDMAVGYAYAALGDLALAEDAVQEAFINAYFELPSLQNAAAFPGWFRRIVIKHVDRIRRKRQPTVVLDDAASLTSSGLGATNVAETLEQKEVANVVALAIRSLPQSQREVVTLFYMGAYSQLQIGEFLGIPVSTVKMRLFHARSSLKEQLLPLVEDELLNKRPSRSNGFVKKIMSFPIQTKHVQNQKVISISRSVVHKDLQAHLDNSAKALMAYAQRHGITITGAPMGIYHGPVRENEAGLVEVCLAIRGEIQSEEPIVVRELPAAQVAYTTTTLRQSLFPGVLKAYEAIEQWISDNGHRITDSPREIYINFNQSIFSPSVGWDDPCLEIAWPYA